MRQGPAYKHKWQSTLLEYKRIVDFHGITGRNEEEYIHLMFAKRREHNLHARTSRMFITAYTS